MKPHIQSEKSVVLTFRDIKPSQFRNAIEQQWNSSRFDDDGSLDWHIWSESWSYDFGSFEAYLYFFHAGKPFAAAHELVLVATPAALKEHEDITEAIRPEKFNQQELRTFYQDLDLTSSSYESMKLPGPRMSRFSMSEHEIAGLDRRDIPVENEPVGKETMRNESTGLISRITGRWPKRTP